MATIHIYCVHIQIRLSSGENDAGMGQFWVEWDLLSDRDVTTFWRHSVGPSVVRSATDHDVEVRSSFAPKRTCCQNKYGIGPAVSWGGGYPTTICYGAGNNDLCMNVDVMSPWASVDGFDKDFPLFDAPTCNSDWPNRYDKGRPSKGGPPFMSVWLR